MRRSSDPGVLVFLELEIYSGLERPSINDNLEDEVGAVVRSLQCSRHGLVRDGDLSLELDIELLPDQVVEPLDGLTDRNDLMIFLPVVKQQVTEAELLLLSPRLQLAQLEAGAASPFGTNANLGAPSSL